MTEITYSHHYDEYSVIAIGHADGSERVCSGVSALLYAAAGWLENHRDRFHNLRYRLDPGDAEIYFEGGGYVGQAVYELTVIGLLQIAESYPKFCRCTKK